MVSEVRGWPPQDGAPPFSETGLSPTGRSLSSQRVRGARELSRREEGRRPLPVTDSPLEGFGRARSVRGRRRGPRSEPAADQWPLLPAGTRQPEATIWAVSVNCAVDPSFGSEFKRSALSHTGRRFGPETAGRREANGPASASRGAGR
jgi:hypothetical protein